eukprot:CAMPEP_0174705962 /NCGR_PEP_ID=MMETSP1094-20130205/8988_1 /TAXON_ID=156173 /ORGANISM="Chrysochromulina brevifilum, Strain UTEX LB 985" /LENGTH=134 /DNA_ID=CAMNT_0015904181 /DNA_START=154 /DNA_END=558 /DNA_ORIENTATION=-
MSSTAAGWQVAVHEECDDFAYFTFTKTRFTSMRGGRDEKLQTARVIASSTTSIASASCASREDGEAARDASVDAVLRVPCCGQASAQLEHSSLGGSAAASATASAVPPSVATGRAAQPKTGAVWWRLIGLTPGM